MAAKRIIPCLDVRNGRTVKGVQFGNLVDAGDPVELALRYNDEGADELVLLDITASEEERDTLIEIVKKVAEKLSIPFTVGGGIRTIYDASRLLEAGADKISVNSASIKNPRLINDLSNEFGSQCVVAAIDSKIIDGSNKVFINGGKVACDIETITWAKELVDRGAGEILLTSMDHDGTNNGYAMELTSDVSKSVTVPVIASGGAGDFCHFKDVFEVGFADAALAAGLFHRRELTIREVKKYLKQFVEVRYD